jgi:hypothetical protein
MMAEDVHGNSGCTPVAAAILGTASLVLSQHRWKCLYVCVLPQGKRDGQDVVVKLFETKRRGAVKAFCQELQAYQKLRVLQGEQLPCLLEHGMFAHTGALFLALTDEGDNLADCEGSLSEEECGQMVDAVNALHR